MLGEMRHLLTTTRRRGLTLLTTGALSIGALSAAPPAQAASWSWTTNLVTDIASKHRHSNPADFTTFRGQVYFTAETGSHGRELWRTDGTDTGTRLVRDIVPGSRSSQPRELTVVGNTLYFFAYTKPGANEPVLWKSDGTTKGTVHVSDVHPAGSFPDLTAVGSTLYFNGTRQGANHELWKSGGTAATTVRVKDILPGGPASDPRELTAWGNHLYFVASGKEGVPAQLWRTDGTEAGTVVVHRPPEDWRGTNPLSLFVAQGKLWFSAPIGTTDGNALWTSDGTAAGTRMVKDLVPGSDWDAPEQFTLFRGQVHFTALDPDPVEPNQVAETLWRTDGTAAGTVPVVPGTTGTRPRALTVAGNRLFYFDADATHGKELWTSDGTARGTRMVKAIVPRNAPPIDEDDDDPRPYHGIAELQSVGDRVVFTASDGRHGRELWTSDGTAAGTRMIRDVNPDQSVWFHDDNDHPDRGEMGVRGNTVLFAADNGKVGTELWKASWAPVNTFTLPRAGTTNPRKGTTKVALRLPNAGKVRVVPAKTRTIRGHTKKVGASGRVNVYLVPTKALRKALVKKAKVRKKKVVATRVKVKVTYTPTHGSARTRVQTYTIKLRVKR